MPRDNSNVIKNVKEGFNMTEVEKMYKSAGVDYEERYNNCILNKEGECKLKCNCDICKYSEEKYIYPPFTAEKQLELIKWIACNKINECKNIDFGEALAELINSFWQSLTEEDKQQIKEILE